VSRARLLAEMALFEKHVFEMAAPIQSPMKCAVRSVIQFLNAKVNVQQKFTKKLLLFMVSTCFFT
jgi:hypothetical protein